MPTRTAPPVEPEPSRAAPPTHRFFLWMRSLGLTRQPGWMGGVCSGIAARLGIDPLIVRGIVVVVAVLGGPAFLLYAAAWLLLPDSNDKIHLEQVIRGRIESPLAGIGALILLSLLPVTQGFWYTGALFWGEPSWGDSLGRVVWTVIVLGLVVGFVIWIARRSSTAEPTVVPATTDDRPETIPQPVAATALVEPEPLPSDAPAEDVAAWREKQAAFKAERDAFRAEAAASARETARLRAEEARARSAAASAERAERVRRWHAANPRAGAAYSAIALGAAALAGGIVALVSPWGEHPATAGLAVAAIVVGLAIAVAGLIRRRTGFLTFVSVVLLGATIVSAALPTDRTVLLWPNYGLSNAVPGRYAQPAGDLTVTLNPSIGDGGVIDVWQGAGSINVYVDEGMTARIEIVSRRGEVWVSSDTDYMYKPLTGQTLVEGAYRSTTTYGTGETPTVTVRIWQGDGSITITDDSTRTDTTP